MSKDKDLLKVTTFVSKSTVMAQIDCLLASAIEGGSNYWASFYFPDGKKSESYSSIVVDAAGNKQDCFYLGKRIFVSENEYKKASDFELSEEALLNGFNIFTSKYPKHYQDIVNEYDDASTGDVFLQCVVFGEVIFG